MSERERNCMFCDTRCFVCIPDVPREAFFRLVERNPPTLFATCQTGREYDRAHSGVDVQIARELTSK